MTTKKSTKKIKALTVRFRGAEQLEVIREAAAIEDLPLNRFIVRSAVAAAVRVKASHSSSSK